MMRFGGPELAVTGVMWWLWAGAAIAGDSLDDLVREVRPPARFLNYKFDDFRLVRLDPPTATGRRPVTEGGRPSNGDPEGRKK